MPSSPPHGFRLSPEDRRLLRSRPPEAALAWAARAVGRGATVAAVQPLEGGTSSAVYALDVHDRAGHVHPLVLRRYVRAEWLAEEPDVPRREAAALKLLTRARPAVATPELVAADPDGADAGGAPALLMTRLPGRIDWAPAELDPYLKRLAAVLPMIHAVPAADWAPAIPAYDPYSLGMHRPPRWATQPTVWLRAIEIHEGPPPVPNGGVFIHRDYHPGNVLWEDGHITGIIDWPCASIGTPEADVGHCRVNLHGRFGKAAADRFLALYQAITGRRSYHPYWDIVAAIGGMDESCDSTPAPADEAFIAAAVAQLTA